MYSSLDQIDIVTKDSQGKEHYIQTDHRDTDEIEDEKEISLLFAVVRMLNPLRINSTNVVRYHSKEMPPLFLQEAIASAGGFLFVGMTKSQQIVYTQKTRDLETLINEAFDALAQKTLAQSSLPCEFASLEILEEQLLEDGVPDKEEEQIIYWNVVFQLAAVAGQLLQKSTGGRWQVGADPQMSSLPIVFSGLWEGEPAKMNLLGKAMKFLANGQEDRVSGMVYIALRSK